MRLAAIDIGTNSTRLLISEVVNFLKTPPNYPDTIIREMEITRLGKNLDKTCNISSEAACLTIGVLNKYKDAIKEYGVTRYRAVGTRALRQAKNSSQFLSDVKRSTGIDVEIIDSGSEARLSFVGAAKSLEWQVLQKKYFSKVPTNILTDNKILVVDIGGGSTEFIVGNLSGRISFLRSLGIGSVNMSERFICADEPSLQQLGKLESYISKKIEPIMEILAQENFTFIVGLAGTISTIAAIDLKIGEYDMEKIHGHLIELSAVKKIYEHFYSVGKSEREKITGLDPKRADIIIGGTAILINIMNRLEIEKCIVSEHDILDGIIYSIMQF